jgi:hypothetical protein
MKYVILSWMGSVLFDGKTFDSFEEGWGFIYENVPLPDPDDPNYDCWYDDFYVEEVKSVQEVQ